jgi:FkbM family methyltransferase
MFYGQFGEDKYLSTFFDNNYKGICIDVGAYDGVNGSNTYHFEKKGWDSLCIEPIPESFVTCNAVRKHTINCCVSNYDKDNVDFNIVRLKGNNVSAISSLTIDNRLIESHKSLIDNIEKISVKVKSLNTIFQEENIPENIDFISIDTENTEIDVLKGIDFNIYNVNFLIIENNFNENIIEDYLKIHNFTKIKRIAVNYFYVNNNYINILIFNCFKITCANYYNKEDNYFGNVTDIVNILLRRYISYNNNDIVVCNEFFDDTLQFEIKKLFITIKNIKNNIEFKFTFVENSTLDFSNIFNELQKSLSKINQIQLSIGEIVDKYSILDLKIKYISEENKITNIKNEMNILYEHVHYVLDSFFYKLLIYINEQIWMDTDIIKKLSINSDDETKIKYFAEVSNRIFENNQKRFRLKTYFNILYNSNIMECKSYSDNKCFIIVNTETDIYDKIPEINYLAISYDFIYFNSEYKNIIEKLFKNHNIQFINEDSIKQLSVSLDLINYNVDNNIRDVFEFDTIKYISGGKFGDFLNQLSVICENFYETGKKGELFISNIGDNFSCGIDYTYNDTYELISSQKYIKKYKIYSNENINIDLSIWREKTDYFSSLNYNWYNIYRYIYNINWGKHKWLISPNYNKKWNDKIIINITPYRFISFDVFIRLFEKISDSIHNCVFVSNEKEHYDFFCEKTHITLEFYTPKNFEETVTIINSCKIGFFGFSSLAVIANALHKPHYMMGVNSIDYSFNNIKSTHSHILDIFV